MTLLEHEVIKHHDRDSPPSLAVIFFRTTFGFGASLVGKIMKARKDHQTIRYTLSEMMWLGF